MIRARDDRANLASPQAAARQALSHATTTWSTTPTAPTLQHPLSTTDHARVPFVADVAAKTSLLLSPLSNDVNLTAASGVGGPKAAVKPPCSAAVKGSC
jgi:hypothetical protein